MVSDDNWILAHRERMIEALGDSDVILELGCGVGRDTTYLEQFGQVVAIDIDADSLHSCLSRAPLAMVIQADIARGIPVSDASFRVAVASLSLHYFNWSTTMALADQLRRCMWPGGMIIVRLNSTKDTDYGAGSNDVIEPNYVHVGSRRKRFFDYGSVLEMFDGWQVELLQERRILRYEKPKWVWELVARAPF